uniref:Uncharacterized protein n=1 Tax=Bos mutus grunniens TaxID=30521 RepID=A0A8B9XXA1_BOSMU
MKCLVTGSNVKGEPSSLSRIGDELYLEPLEDGVRRPGMGSGVKVPKGALIGARVSPHQAGCPPMMGQSPRDWT